MKHFYEIQFYGNNPDGSENLSQLSELGRSIGLDLSKPDQAKAALATVEKMASEDPKTLVQAAAISALAKTKEKKYLPVFEKGMNAVSNAVKGSSLSGRGT